MRTDEFLDVLGEIDEEMVARAKSRVDDPIKVKVERGAWKPFAAVAACLAVAVIGIAVFIGANSRRDEIIKPDSSGSGSDPTVVNSEYPESAKYQYKGDFSELELCEYAIVDRMVYNSFAELEKASELIVVGTFVDDARQDQPVTGSFKERPNSMGRGSSFNRLRIDEVYKGNVGVGSEIVICDSYFVNGGKLLYVDGATSTPMIKGEQWVYFLEKVSPEYGSYYYSVGSYDGRFFVPGNENTFVLEDMGGIKGYESVYDDVKIMLGLVSGAKKLDIEDWQANYEFTMPEFIGDTFVKRASDIYLAGTSRILFGAPGVISVYLADLNGDGKREIISECWNGLSGLSANHIMAYDHANSKLYVLQHSAIYSDMLWDYCPEIRDGVLYAVGHALGRKEFSAEPLTLEMMTETELHADRIAYEDKTYDIVKSLYTTEGVQLMVGLTMPEYEAGGYIEVLGVVENNTAKDIGLLTPCINGKYNFEFGTMISMDGTQLYEAFTEGYGFDDAMGTTIVKPGERFIHAMRFDTRAERLDDEDTLLPLLNPLGDYKGKISIHLLTEPHSSDEDTTYTLEFNVSVVQREEVQYPEEIVRVLEEFGDTVEFLYNRRTLRVRDSQELNQELFGGAPIENLYLVDLNGDGYRELCATVCCGSGIIDTRIMAYDFNNKKLYELSDRGYYDYRMCVEYNGYGNYRVLAKKYKYTSSDMLSEEWLSLDIMTEVTRQTTDVRELVSGASEIVGFDKTFSMKEFPNKTFYVGERMLKVTIKDGGEEGLFNAKIENVYLCDLNGDGKREIIVKGFCNVLNGNTGITSYDAEKIITVIDIENNYGINLYPGSKECSLIIVDDAIHIVIDGEVEPEPLTYERFGELAKSL